MPDLLNFTDVQACGTSTEVSLPCMFAPVGRRDYDESRVRGSESLLHVLARAGFQVQWLAAATYDRAVGISLFTLQVTHRVDADIDIERDYAQVLDVRGFTLLSGIPSPRNEATTQAHV